MLLESGPDASLMMAKVIHAKSSIAPLHYAESYGVFTFHVDKFDFRGGQTKCSYYGELTEGKDNQVSFAKIVH